MSSWLGDMRVCCVNDIQVVSIVEAIAQRIWVQPC